MHISKNNVTSFRYKRAIKRCMDPCSHEPIKKIETNFYEAHKNMHFHIHPIKNNFLFGTLSSIPYSKPIRHTYGGVM